MTILRRNLFRFWILCCFLWLVFVAEVFVHDRPPDNELIFVAAFFFLPPIILFFAGLALARIWERFGEQHWLRLPQYLRRGLTRLYLVVAVPWVAWYSYQIIEAAQHSGNASQRAISHAFWSLLIVPIGGPILFGVIMWVIAGFRNTPPTIMDAFIRLAYGNSPPPKTAKLQDAIELSYAQLLGRIVDIEEVRSIATQLYNGPIPYSTHDLAVATALNLLRSGSDGPRRERFVQIQIFARMVVLDWMKEKKVVPLLAKSFEDTLYERYKPQI
jgi:hypothetical protein